MCSSDLFNVARQFAKTINPKNIKKLYWLAGIGATTLFVMLFAFSNFYRIPLGVMQLYKFGNIQTTELVLKKEACKAFSSLKIEVIEYGSDICVAKNILILSRLGKNAYLQYKNEHKTVKFTISTDQIVSWAIQKTNDDIGKKE